MAEQFLSPMVLLQASGRAGHLLQAKLTIGASNDPLEQEADRVADQVLAAPTNPAASGVPPHIQRSPGQPSAPADTAPASIDHALAGPGSPLDPALRQDMEQRFGYDFSRVRMHSGAAAEQSAREVNANAYTVGHDVVFRAGRFAPATHEGRRLLAHELAHVVQQSSLEGISASQSNEKRGLSPTHSRIQRQPEGAPRAISTGLKGENRALRDGVPIEKWSEELESQYRIRGHFARANAIRACRLEGMPACRRILTSAELQVLYDRNIVPQQATERAPGGPPTAAAGGVAVATALAVQGGAAAESAVATTATERAVLAGVRAATVGVEPTVGAATVEAAVPVGASTGAAAPVVAGATFVLPAVITGYHWYRWKTFQEKWIAAGYVLLEDPLRICTGGCHLPSVPKRPTDLPEFPPVEPVGPFPFHPPRQPLPPEWTELKPFEAKRAAPRAIPTPGPKSVPKPDPRTEDRRRGRRCEPHLELPKGKAMHTERYGLEILASRLAAAPTSILNGLRTTAYERYSNQVKKWLAAVDPDKNGKMSSQGS